MRSTSWSRRGWIRTGRSRNRPRPRDSVLEPTSTSSHEDSAQSVRLPARPCDQVGVLEDVEEFGACRCREASQR